MNICCKDSDKREENKISLTYFYSEPFDSGGCKIGLFMKYCMDYMLFYVCAGIYIDINCLSLHAYYI